MKPKKFLLLPNFMTLSLGLSVAVLSPFGSPTAQAATRTKAASGTDLTNAASWDALPTAADIATWDTGSLGAVLTLNAGTPSWLGIKVNAGATDPIIIGSGGTLTLGTGGIDMSASAINLSIASGLTLGAGTQTWNVATGRTLTLTGALTRSAGATLVIDKTTNTGTVTASPTLVNGVLPWAIVKSSGTAANNSANGYTFGTVTSGNIVAYTAATAVTTSYPANAATVNYDWSAAGTQAQIGSSRAANTIRYTGTGVTQTTNSTQTETFNALMNAGTGLVTLGGGSTMNIQSAVGVNELVLAAMTAGITINGPIINNGANAGAVTILGAGSNAVTLGATNTFTGGLNVNSGTLSIAANTALGGTTGTAGAVTLNGGTLATTAGMTNTHAFTIGTAGGTIKVNSTGQYYFTTANTLLGSGPLTVTGSSGTLAGQSTGAGNLRVDKTNTYSGSLTVNSGGIFEYGIAGAVGAGATFTIGNEGEVAVQGSSAVNLSNAIAVTGGTNSVISFENGTAGIVSGNIALNANLTVGLRDWYNYATVRSGTISGVISGSGGLSTNTGTSTSAGILTLSGANTYTGATNVNAGTLTAGVASVAGVSGAFGLNSAVTTANVANAGINLNGFSTQIGSLAGGGATGGNLALGAGTLTTGGNNTSTSYGGAITGTGGITKIGSGTQTLTSGSNAYTGATNINAGTLAFSTNAQNLASSAFTVADGAGLSVKAVSAAGTILTTGSLTVGTSGSTSLAFDFGGFNPTVTQISTGALTLNGTIGVSFAGTSGLGTNTYTLIDYTSGLGGTGFSSFNPTAFTFGHSSGTLINNTGNTSIDLSVVADSLAWSGAGVQTWNTVATGNNTSPNDWATKSGHVATNFWVSDAVEFNDTYNIGAGDVGVVNRTVTITGADVNPSGATFNNSTGDYSVTGSFGITGSGVLIKNGTSKATISTSNSYTGGTTINAGTLAINTATSLGASSGALTVNNGTLQTTADITTSRNITLGNANSTVLTDSGTTYATSGVVSGSGILNKTGTGTLTLSGANTYTGGTAITAGVVSIAADNNLGTSAAAVALNGGTLRTTAGITNTHAVTVGAGGGTINVPTTGQYFFNTVNTLLGSGPLTVTGNGTLTANTGNLRIGQTNTYSGAVTLNSGGIFEYGVAGAVGAGATFDIGNQGELAVQTGISLPNAVTVSGGTNSVLSFENGTTGNLTGSLTLNANVIVGLRDWYNYATVRGGTISGQITGTGGITVNSGSGTGGGLTLSNVNNTYSGGTTISASKVSATASGAIGTGAVAISGTGAQLILGGTTAGSYAYSPSSTSINGGGATAQGIIWAPNPTTGSNTVTYNGPIGITANAASGGHFGSGNLSTLNITGAVTSSVAVTSRIGTVVFSNTGSSYSQLNVQEGTVRLGATDALPVGASVDLGLSAGAFFDLAGFNQTLAGITKNANAATVTNSGTSDSTLTTTGTSAFAGVIQNGGTNTTGVTVNSGSLTLSGSNTYTGVTSVAGGKLLVNGSNTGAGAYNVGASGTLGGTGTVGLSTINVSGVLSPGASVETLSSGTVNFSGGSTYAYELNSAVAAATGADLQVISGDLGLTGTVTLTLTDLAAIPVAFAPGSIFSLLNYSGSWNGGLFTLAGNSLADDATFTSGLNTWQIDYNAATGGLNYTGEYLGGSDSFVNITAVPEPASVLLGGLGVLFLLRRRR